jgi:tRNA A37 threonylcarbamoyladenosine modification protein TsaB
MLVGQEKPVIPVTSLEAWAFKRKGMEGNIVSLIDGRRGEIYMSEYNGLNSSGLLVEILPPLLTGVESISDFLPQKKKYIFTGSGVLKYKEKISEIFKSSVFESDKPFLSYEISQIALLKYNSGVYLDDSNDLLPLYIRKPDAEKNFK